MQTKLKQAFHQQQFAKWQSKGKNIEFQNQVKAKLNHARAQSQANLQFRRQKLAMLLREEQENYQKQIIASQQTPEQIRQKMAARVQQLNAEKYSRRKDEVNEKLERRFLQNADQLRKVDQELKELRTAYQRNIQMVERQNKLQNQYEQQILFAELNKRDIKKKQEAQKLKQQQMRQKVNQRNAILAIQKQLKHKKSEEEKTLRYPQRQRRLPHESVHPLTVNSRAQDGDTLESIAESRSSGDIVEQQRLLAAMQRANPGLSPDQPLPEGETVLIPRVRRPVPAEPISRYDAPPKPRRAEQSIAPQAKPKKAPLREASPIQASNNTDRVILGAPPEEGKTRRESSCPPRQSSRSRRADAQTRGQFDSANPGSGRTITSGLKDNSANCRMPSWLMSSMLISPTLAHAATQPGTFLDRNFGQLGEDFEFGQHRVSGGGHIQDRVEENRPEDQTARFLDRRRGVVAHQDVGQDGSADREAEDEGEKIGLLDPPARVLGSCRERLRRGGWAVAPALRLRPSPAPSAAVPRPHRGAGPAAASPLERCRASVHRLPMSS